jgi:hypothetical protein
MPIVASIVLEDAPQVDGRRWIRERHTDQVGVQHFRAYMVAAGVNVPATFPATVAILDPQLKVDEFNVNLVLIFEKGDLATPVWQHLTIAEAGTPMRNAYKAATREQSYALGAFLDTLTNVQLANMFGYGNPSAQLTNLRNNVTAKRAQWHDYIAAVGE